MRNDVKERLIFSYLIVLSVVIPLVIFTAPFISNLHFIPFCILAAFVLCSAVGFPLFYYEICRAEKYYEEQERKNADS